MSYDNKVKFSSILNIDVLAGFIILLGTMYSFNVNITSHLSGIDPSIGIPTYAYFMLGISLIAFTILIIYTINEQATSFIWIPMCYVIFASMSTIISGMYTLQRLPFRFVELFYWVAAMLLSYYSVKNLKTLKLHVFIVALAVPFLSYRFLLLKTGESAFAGMLLLNPAYYIAFLMPIILLLRIKILKIALLVLIFTVIVLSYKRMAIIAYATSIIVYFYCIASVRHDSNIGKKMIILVGVSIFLVILAFSFEYISAAFRLDWAQRMSDISEGGGRFERWSVMIDVIMRQPEYWFYGHGHGAMASSYLGYAHNDILEITYDFGFVGLALYGLISIKLIMILLEMKRYNYQNYAAFAVSFVWAFCGGMTDVYINHPYWSLAIAIFWGITVADFENEKLKRCWIEYQECLQPNSNQVMNDTLVAMPDYYVPKGL